MSTVSLVIPTYNEADGLAELVREIFTALHSVPVQAEVVIVDDNSPDGTGEVADALARQYPLRVVHRPGKMGLASAVMDGLAVAKGDIVGVMDADFSHPPSLLPALTAAIIERGADLAVASRYVPGGGVENWPWRRAFVSAVANWLARPCTPIKDATSGYLLARRQVLEGARLNPIGFKIGLEIMVKGHYQRWEEVPYVFTDRRFGRSKFGAREVVAYLRHLALLLGHRVRQLLGR